MPGRHCSRSSSCWATQNWWNRVGITLTGTRPRSSYSPYLIQMRRRQHSEVSFLKEAGFCLNALGRKVGRAKGCSEACFLINSLKSISQKVASGWQILGSFHKEGVRDKGLFLILFFLNNQVKITIRFWGGQTLVPFSMLSLSTPQALMEGSLERKTSKVSVATSLPAVGSGGIFVFFLIYL